jgi:hypothetical protein
MITARLTVYLQALGGKFLGPNAYNTNDINLSLTLNGNTERITYQLVDQVNDGAIGPTFLYSIPSTYGESSFLPILTPSTADPSAPSVNYLTPNNLTICGRTKADFSQPEVLGTLSASIPRPHADDLLLTQSIALNQLQSEYRVIMSVPGLLLEKPPASVIPPNSKNLYLWVKMMCGCPITTGIPNSFWAENDFLVTAEIFPKNGGREVESLTFTSDATPSLFVAAGTDVNNIKHVNFTARQKSTGNIGYVSLDY